MKKKNIIFGAGEEGAKALKLLGNDEVYCFADNDSSRHNTEYYGKKVISFTELLDICDNYNVVISVDGFCLHTIASQLENAGIKKYQFLSDVFESLAPITGLLKYKGMFSGERCFVIGTGPSLNPKDLDVLYKHNEISFAPNKIFKIFPFTKWRPLLYCATDSKVMSFYSDTILQLSIPHILLSDLEFPQEQVSKSKMKENISFFRLANKVSGDFPCFSCDPARVVYKGFTVIYSMLQWCAYMGFSKVYLIGVDFTYQDSSGSDKNAVDHFCKDYMEKNEIVNAPRMDVRLRAFQKAEQYSRHHGFRIYNATRGGQLEVFERISFDDLFNGQE